MFFNHCLIRPLVFLFFLGFTDAFAFVLRDLGPFPFVLRDLVALPMCTQGIHSYIGFVNIVNSEAFPICTEGLYIYIYIYIYVYI